jgi:hypothetical protein
MVVSTHGAMDQGGRQYREGSWGVEWLLLAGIPATEALDQPRPLVRPGAAHQASPGEEGGAQVLGGEMVQLRQNGQRQALGVEPPVTVGLRMGHRGLAHHLVPPALRNGREGPPQHGAQAPPEARALLPATETLPPAPGQPVCEQGDQALHDPVILLHEAWQRDALGSFPWIDLGPDGVPALDSFSQVLRDVGRERRQLGVAQERGQIDEVRRHLPGTRLGGRPPPVRYFIRWGRPLPRIVTPLIDHRRVRQHACDPHSRCLAPPEGVTDSPEVAAQLVQKRPLAAWWEAAECVLEDPAPEGFKRRPSVDCRQCRGDDAEVRTQRGQSLGGLATKCPLPRPHVDGRQLGDRLPDLTFRDAGRDRRQMVRQLVPYGPLPAMFERPHRSVTGGLPVAGKLGQEPGTREFSQLLILLDQEIFRTLRRKWIRCSGHKRSPSCQVVGKVPTVLPWRTSGCRSPSGPAFQGQSLG